MPQLIRLSMVVTCSFKVLFFFFNIWKKKEFESIVENLIAVRSKIGTRTWKNIYTKNNNFGE